MIQLTITILLVLCLVVILKDIVLSLLFSFSFKKSLVNDASGFPLVSVLVAARNEEHTIEKCLEALCKQDYPVDRYEILIGNDGSDDRTLEILKKLEGGVNNLSVFNIEKVIQKKAGKMNVLAQLGEMAQGEFMLFTDADTRVPESWVKNMTKELLNGRGIVSGTTLPDAKDTFGRLQRLEWGHALGMMKVISDLNIPVSSIGNNFGISKEAYNSVGGFRGIPFSLTEDHEIFSQVRQLGYESFHIFDPANLSYSIPSASLWHLLIQRKRWMDGAFRLPVLILSVLILDTIYYLAIILLLFISLGSAITLFLFRILVHGVFIKLAFDKLGEKTAWTDILLYEFYAGLVNLGALIVFLLPVRIKWKNRKY